MSRAFRPVVVSTIALLTSAVAAASTVPGVLPGIPSHHASEISSKQQLLDRAMRAKSWAPEPTPSPIDVLHYDLSLHLDVSREQLSGAATIHLAAVEDGLDTVELDVDGGLRVVSVSLLEDPRYPHDSPCPLPYTHAEDRLAVALPQPLAPDDEVRLLVVYGGHASRDGYGLVWARNAGRPLVYTFAEPFGARVWWPCNDRPDDKATVDLEVTVPADLVVSSNGLEVGRVDHADGTATTSWSSVYPVATYLVVMNVGVYDVDELTYTALDGDTMPVVTYAFPSVAGAAAASLANTPEMIEVLAGRYGEYPFVDEKYGNCLTFFGGGMEHQTLTTYAVSAIGSDWAPWLNVHELAHQWWGDWVTCDDWRELWLNEGFAVHSEWLWAEHLGMSVLQQQLADSDPYGHFVGPLYDNPVAFSSTVYEKGAWVLRMLRYVVGDAAFFAGVHDYRQAYAGGSATSEELRAAMETASGMDLEWFFDQWVYGANRPRLRYDWQATSDPSVQLTIDQTHTNALPFRLAMEVDITTDAGTERKQVWIEAERSQVIDIPVSAPPTGIVLDPEEKLLAEIAHVSQPDVDLGPEFPGPFDAGIVRSGNTATITIPVTNVGGADLQLRAAHINSGVAFSVVSPDLPLNLPPGESVDLQIEFSPRGFGQQLDYVFLQTSDPSHQGFALIRLTGTGAMTDAPRLLAQASLDFGTAAVNGVVEKELPIINWGATPLTLTAEIVGDDFAFAGAVPDVVQPGGRISLWLRYSPAAPGPSEGALRLLSNDPDSPETVVDLSGDGVGASRIEVSPTVLAFGLAPSGAEAGVLVANTGEEPLTVAALSVDGPFEIADAPSLPFTLGPATGEMVTLEFLPSGPEEARGTLRILSDDPAIAWTTVPLAGRLMEGDPDRLGITAVASTPGFGGAIWSTDAFLLNPGDDELAVDLSFLPGETRSAGAVDMSVSVPAGEQRSLHDLVRRLGQSGAGGLDVAASGEGLVVASRTFSSEAAGTYGQHIPAVDAEGAPAAGSRWLLPGLHGNGDFHTNLGFLNLSDAETSVSFELFDAQGTSLGAVTLTAGPRAHRQANRVWQDLTVDQVRGGYAIVTAQPAGSRFAPYASVVDDVSHDPTYVSPAEITGAAVHGVIPVVSARPGDAGTVWQSGLSVVNPGAIPANVELALRRDSDGSVTSTIAFQLQPGETRYDENVVSDLGVPWTGSVEVTADAWVGVVARIYNNAADGTYGQSVPLVPAGAILGSGDVALLPALRSDGYRTNVGVVSTAAVPIQVLVRVFSDDGEVVGEVPIDVPAGGLLQVNRILGDLSFTGAAWAEVSSDDAGASFLTYASVVDEASGDPSFIAPLSATNVTSGAAGGR